MNIHLRVWRQAGPDATGRFEIYTAENVSPDMSFLEMLDLVNEQLIRKNQEPVAFDSDCREGICGSCGFLVNGRAHAPEPGTTVCQLHMRKFRDGDTITVEPWRANASLLRRLVVTAAFDRLFRLAAYVRNVGGAPTRMPPDSRPEAKRRLTRRSASVAGCVPACKNASAGALHVGENRPPCAPARPGRAAVAGPYMVGRMDAEGSGRARTRGMRGSLPEGHLLSNIAAEPGVLAGAA